MGSGSVFVRNALGKFWAITLVALIASVFSQVTKADESPHEIEVPKKLRKKLKSFEPSAAVFLPGSGNYLLASDDTTEEDTAMVFLMDDNGRVSKDPVYFDGLDTMTDIESLSADDGWVYALSSLSRNKKGKVLEERNLFARGRYGKGRLAEVESVELRSLLLRSLASAADPRLQKMKSRYDTLLETEASLVREGRLIIGLKDPQPRAGTAYVLDLGDVNSIFQGKGPEVNVAMQLEFGGEHKLSDMIIDGKRFLFATTLESGGGSIWSYEPSIEKLVELRQFSGVQPEGVAMNDKTGDLLMVFDQGDENALFTKERL